MTEAPAPRPPEAAHSHSSDARAEAVLALHLIALRRQFEAIRAVFGDEPPHRAREALWALLEITSADLQGRQIALRDLVARAEGLFSGPTLSRVVAELSTAASWCPKRHRRTAGSSGSVPRHRRGASMLPEPMPHSWSLPAQ